MSKLIDPKTTRRRITMKEWNHNRALYATYRAIGNETAPTGLMMVIEKKPEFCKPAQQAVLLRAS